MLNLNNYKIPGLTEDSAEVEAKRAAAVSAAVELASLIPLLGPAISAVAAYVEARAAELRYQQLTDFLTEVRQRVESIDITKIDIAWLKSEEGVRVFLSLGESACDLLHEEKVTVLAGAEFASCLAEKDWAADRKHFASIIADINLDSLLVLRLMASRFSDRTNVFPLSVGRYSEEIAQEAKAIYGTSLTTPITADQISDAVDDLRRYRLAGVSWMPTHGDSLPDMAIISPRPAWGRFSAYLREVVPGSA